jgi:hypothetical protein
LCGFVTATVVAELLLHAFPFSTGYGNSQVDSLHPVSRGTPYLNYTYSRDWTFHLANSGKLNNEGFRASYDYNRDPQAVAVVGNSFVQGDALPPAAALTERIGTLTGHRGFGVASDGFSLADYLAASQWATEYFGIHTVVILLTTEDLSRSCAAGAAKHYLKMRAGVISYELVPRAATEHWKTVLNQSGLFRYLFDNLHAPANWARGWRRMDNDPEPADGAQEPAAARGCATPQFQSAAIRFLLSAFRNVQATSAARLIFLIAPDYYQRHTVRGASRDIDAFADQAETEGFEVLRLSPAFQAAERTGIKLSLKPIDLHWSAAAHELAAQSVADYLRRTPSR